MLVRIQVMPGRRVRDRYTKKVYVAGQEATVEWGPAWEKKLRDGDIERLEAGRKPVTPKAAKVTE